MRPRVGVVPALRVREAAADGTDDEEGEVEAELEGDEDDDATHGAAAPRRREGGGGEEGDAAEDAEHVHHVREDVFDFKEL